MSFDPPHFFCSFTSRLSSLEKKRIKSFGNEKLARQERYVEVGRYRYVPPYKDCGDRGVGCLVVEQDPPPCWSLAHSTRVGFCSIRTQQQLLPCFIHLEILSSFVYLAQRSGPFQPHAKVFLRSGCRSAQDCHRPRTCHFGGDDSLAPRGRPTLFPCCGRGETTVEGSVWSVQRRVFSRPVNSARGGGR